MRDPGEGEIEARIAERLLPLTQHDGGPPPPYVRRHLIEHAAAGGILDERFVTWEFLPYVDALRSLPLLEDGTLTARHPLMAVWQGCGATWSWSTPEANADALEFAAAVTGLPASGAGRLTRRWTTRWTRRGSAPHQAPRDLAAVVTPAGRPLALAPGEGSTVQVWDLDAGEPAHEPLIGHSAPVSAVAAVVTPDGRPIGASGDRTGYLRVWDLDRGAPIGASLNAHDEDVSLTSETAPSAGPPSLVSWCVYDESTQLTVWNVGADAPDADVLTVRHVMAKVLPAADDVDGAECIDTLDLEYVRMAAGVASDGRAVLVTGGAAVHVWDLATGALIGEPFAEDIGDISAIAVTTSPDGRTLVVIAGVDATVHVWDLDGRRELAHPLRVTTTVRALAAWPEHDRVGIAVATDDLLARIDFGGVRS